MARQRRIQLGRSFRSKAARRLFVVVLLLRFSVSAIASADQLKSVNDGVLQTTPADLLAPSEHGGNQDSAAADTARALALFAQGHAAKRRGQYAEALSSFQRAWFWDLRHRKVLDEIVSLAFSLNHNDSAVKYAVIAAEIEPRDPNLIRQLGDILIQRGEYERAARLFEAALKLVDSREQASASAEHERKTLALQLHRELAKAAFLGDLTEVGIPALQATIEGLRSHLGASDDDGVSEAIQRELVLYWDMLGELHRQSRSFDQARTAFRAARNLDGSESAWFYWQAQLAADQGNQAVARQLLADYLTTSPQEAGVAALELLVEVHHDNAPSLTRQLEQAYDENPEDRVLGFFLADRHLKLDEPEKAAQTLESLFNDQPSLDAYRGLLRCYQQLGRTSSVIALLGQLVESNLNLLAIDEEISALLNDPEFVEAIAVAAEVARQDQERPMLAGEAFAVALVLAEADRWNDADAFQQLSAALTDGPERVKLVSAWAIECLAREQYARATESFERQLQLVEDPTATAETQFYLATSLALEDKVERAMELIDQAIEAEPDSIAFLQRKAWILQSAGRAEEALSIFEAIVERFSAEGVPSQLQEVRVSLASIAAELDRIELAQNHLLAVLAHDPDNYGAKNDLGYLWADNGRHLARAKSLIDDAIAEEPNNAAYLDSAGWVHYRMGNFAEARDLLQRAAETVDPPDGVILDHLGDTHAALGDQDAARKAWKQAVEAFRETEQFDKIETVERKIDTQWYRY